MRRKEKEITDLSKIEVIIQKAQICRLGFCDGNLPYIVPMNFGYADKCLYFHCAKEGKKLDILRKNNNVCFEIDVDHELILSDEKACSGTAKFRSVIGFGKAEIIEDNKEKISALNQLMEHYTGKSAFEYLDEQVKNITIIKVIIESMGGKESGY